MKKLTLSLLAGCLLACSHPSAPTIGNLEKLHYDINKENVDIKMDSIGYKWFASDDTMYGDTYYKNKDTLNKEMYIIDNLYQTIGYITYDPDIYINLIKSAKSLGYKPQDSTMYDAKRTKLYKDLIRLEFEKGNLEKNKVAYSVKVLWKDGYMSH